MGGFDQYFKFWLIRCNSVLAPHYSLNVVLGQTRHICARLMLVANAVLNASGLNKTALFRTAQTQLQSCTSVSRLYRLTRRYPCRRLITLHTWAAYWRFCCFKALFSHPQTTARAASSWPKAGTARIAPWGGTGTRRTAGSVSSVQTVWPRETQVQRPGRSAASVSNGPCSVLVSVIRV